MEDGLPVDQETVCQHATTPTLWHTVAHTNLYPQSVHATLCSQCMVPYEGRPAKIAPLPTHSHKLPGCESFQEDGPGDDPFGWSGGALCAPG